MVFKRVRCSFSAHVLAEDISRPEIPDIIPVASTTDWQAAFGFSNSIDSSHDDDLGMSHGMTEITN